jgi:hypothetical protein
LFGRGDLSELLHVKNVLNSQAFSKALRPFGAGFFSFWALRGDLRQIAPR